VGRIASFIVVAGPVKCVGWSLRHSTIGNAILIVEPKPGTFEAFSEGEVVWWKTQRGICASLKR
jgi:hypothetical protein